MKFMIFIIALYVNVLSFIPCQDTNSNGTLTSMVHSENETPNQDEGSAEPTD